MRCNSLSPSLSLLLIDQRYSLEEIDVKNVRGIFFSFPLITVAFLIPK